MTVFMLPFAGGSAYAYRPLIGLVPPGVRCVPLELPGRGSRRHEPHAAGLPGMAADVHAQIASQPAVRCGEPFALFGHSMGALVAWLVARSLRRAGGHGPSQLVVSGMQAPSQIQPRPRASLSSPELRRELARLGGSPAEVLADEDLYAFFEPIIRADFASYEAFRYEAEPPLDVPVTVLIGENDGIAADGRGWQEETTRPLTVRAFPGGHFFVFTAAAAVARALAEAVQDARSVLSFCDEDARPA